MDQYGRLDAEAAVAASIAYTEYPVGENQFHVQFGRSACTAAALAASLYTLHYVASMEIDDETQTMPNLPWSTIVNTGARLWREYVRAARRPGFVECGELLGCGGKFCTTVKGALEVVEEVAGHTDNAVVAVMDPDSLVSTLVQFVEKIPSRSAGVITAMCGNAHEAATANVGDNNNRVAVGEEVAATVAVFRISLGDSYWIYDSHGGPDTGGAALLCDCPTAESAAAALASQLPDGLFSATIYRRRRNAQ